MVEPFTLTARTEHGVLFSVGGKNEKTLRTGTTDKVPPDRNFHALLRANGLGPSSRLWLIADLDQQRNSPSFQQREVIMKKLQWLGACALVLAVAVVTANSEDGKPALKAPTSSEATTSSPAAAVTTSPGVATAGPSIAASTEKQKDTRLKRIEEALGAIQNALAERTPSDSQLDKVIEEKLNPVTNSFRSLDKRIAAMEDNVTALKIDVPRIGARLGMNTKPTFDEGGAAIQSFPDEVKSRLDKLDAKVPVPPQEPEDGIVFVRNKTGESQTLFVEGKEYKIAGDGFEYEIPVKLVRSDKSVLTQVWPYDKPKLRVFQKTPKGVHEVRFEITLRPIP